jgi:glycosyltransferase involved in cell wall biosynthesis/SAM-dependent methyltransferase
VDLDIALLVPGLPFQGDSLESRSLGGSETAGLCLSRELARLGHHVVVFANCERPGLYDGVLYRPAGEFADYATSAPHDVTIVQRMPEAFATRMASRLNILWCHDLALMRQAATFKAVLWNVDRVAVLSRYMAEQYREVYGIPDEIFWQTRNGIELVRFDGLDSLGLAVEGVPRDRQKLIYGARPERGADVLLGQILPQLLQEEPGLRLYLASYDNRVDHLRPFYEQVDRLISRLGDRVVFLGALPKRQYYEHLATAGVYVYPTPSPTNPTFAEISCITAMECQAAGLPIVTSARGALPETIAPGAGVLVDGDPSSPEYQDDFTAAVLHYVRDGDAWREASEAGRARAVMLDWRGVASEWAETFERLIREQNDSPHRLAHHFIRRSDIMAARTLLDPLTDEVAGEIRERIDREWGFSESRDGLRGQYEKIGQTHTDVFAQVPNEPRFQMLEQWFRAHPDVQRVLDFGCAHGGYSVNMANRVGRDWVGVDIDRHSIDWCERNRRDRATIPDALRFVVGDDQVDLSGEPPFDCLLLFEILEHVPDPTTLLDRLERWVKPDGYVLITVPYGPWEWMSYETYPHRCHLWEFDLHDLRDLFGKKKERSVQAMGAGVCEDLAEPLGWHIVEYRVDGTPTGRIDLERKLALQRPRETASALLIAGPNSEETLHWCLRSLKTVADEIVIGDAGMSDEGRRIAGQYAVRVLPASNPIERGFETPRNEALAVCRMDWVLWIDTDEKLLDPRKLHKYFRRNLFAGYSIRQHHFAVDTAWKPDLPVRCFRRGPRGDGKTMRWYGMVHEHPEHALNEGPGTVIILSDVHIAHVGYLIESGRRQRFGRNWPLLQKDIATYPDRIIQKHFICRDNVLLAQWELSQNGGLVTPAIRERLEEVKRLYREHFLGKGHYLNTDTLSHYSQALLLLGEGVEVAFAVGATKDGQAVPGDLLRARFASAEEAEREIAWRTREAMAAYVSPWW